MVEKRRPAGWFETLELNMSAAYKEQTLRYPVTKTYRSIRLSLGQNNFALGLEERSGGNGWEGFCSDFWDRFSRISDGFPSPDEEGELERPVGWPHMSEEAHELQLFLACVMMAKIYAGMRRDNALASRLKAIDTVTIDGDDVVSLPFTGYFPSIADRERMVQTYCSDSRNQALVLDLWADQLTGSGAELLEDIGVEPLRSTMDSAMLRHQSLRRSAQEYWSYDHNQVAIDILGTHTKSLAVRGDHNSASLNRAIDASCTLLAKCDKELKNFESAAAWYTLGCSVVPASYGALNLMKMLKTQTQNWDALINFGESHIGQADQHDADYFFYCHLYLAFAQLVSGNSSRAQELYAIIHSRSQRPSDSSRAKEAVQSVEEAIKLGGTGGEILTMLMATGVQGDT